MTIQSPRMPRLTPPGVVLITAALVKSRFKHGSFVASVARRISRHFNWAQKGGVRRLITQRAWRTTTDLVGVLVIHAIVPGAPRRGLRLGLHGTQPQLRDSQPGRLAPAQERAAQQPAAQQLLTDRVPEAERQVPMSRPQSDPLEISAKPTPPASKAAGDQPVRQHLPRPRRAAPPAAASATDRRATFAAAKPDAKAAPPEADARSVPVTVTPDAPAVDEVSMIGKASAAADLTVGDEAASALPPLAEATAETVPLEPAAKQTVEPAESLAVAPTPAEVEPPRIAGLRAIDVEEPADTPLKAQLLATSESLVSAMAGMREALQSNEAGKQSVQAQDSVPAEATAAAAPASAASADAPQSPEAGSAADQAAQLPA